MQHSNRLAFQKGRQPPEKLDVRSLAKYSCHGVAEAGHSNRALRHHCQGRRPNIGLLLPANDQPRKMQPCKLKDGQGGLVARNPGHVRKTVSTMALPANMLPAACMYARIQETHMYFACACVCMLHGEGPARQTTSASRSHSCGRLWRLAPVGWRCSRQAPPLSPWGPGGHRACTHASMHGGWLAAPSTPCNT